jgi:tetratricopeptide (TPR) repeat protein
MDPRWIPAKLLVTKASIAMDLDRYEEVVEAAKAAIDVDSRMTEAWFLHGEANRLLGHRDDARESLEQACELDPTDVRPLRSLGNLLVSEQRLGQARAQFQRAWELEPDDPWPMADVAQLDHLEGHPKQALALLSRALSRDPANYWALLVKARVLLDIGEFAAGAAAADKAAKNAYPALLSELHTDRGFGLEHLGPTRAAECHEAYALAVKLDDSNLDAHRGLGIALEMLGHPADAGEHYRLVADQVERQPEASVDTIALMAWCLAGLRDYDTAIQLCGNALSGAPHVTDTLYIRFDFALIQLCSGRRELALHEYKRAITSVRRVNPWRRRGILRVAQAELRTARRVGRAAQRAAAPALTRLQAEVQAATKEARARRSADAERSANADAIK